MKRNEIKDLHKKPIKELETMLRTQTQELVETELKLRANKLKNIHQVIKLRHNLARIRTILKEKKL